MIAKRSFFTYLSYKLNASYETVEERYSRYWNRNNKYVRDWLNQLSKHELLSFTVRPSWLGTGEPLKSLAAVSKLRGIQFSHFKQKYPYIYRRYARQYP